MDLCNPLCKGTPPGSKNQRIIFQQAKIFLKKFESDPEQHIDLVAILVGSAFCVIFALAEQGLSGRDIVLIIDNVMFRLCFDYISIADNVTLLTPASLDAAK